MCTENQQVTKSDFLLRITPTHRKAKNRRLEFLTGDFSKINENGSFYVNTLKFSLNVYYSTALNISFIIPINIHCITIRQNQSPLCCIL